MDQGAVQALPIFRVSTRQQSGLVETAFKPHVADRTNWRTMLKGEIETLDLRAERDRLLAATASEIGALQERFGLQAIQPDSDAVAVNINYPVQEYPLKVASHNLDKTPELRGTLNGIKGQYLILDTGVINMRKYGGYHISLARE
jgi:hypothetical protein